MVILRHARAGDRDAWEGDDEDRPLDERGGAQAQLLVQELAPFEVERILCSPARRCVETVEPIAHARGLEIERRAELVEERQHTDGAELVRSLADANVLVCGHGGLENAVPGAPRLKKGAFFLVD